MIQTNLTEYFDRFEQLKSYVGWSDEDAHLVKNCKPLVEPKFEFLIDDFYEAIQRTSNAMKVITGGTRQIEQLKKSLTFWIHQLFDGPYDKDYVIGRLRVGTRHVEIGLDQVYTNVAMSRLRSIINQTICEKWTDTHQELSRSISSVNRILDLDLAVIEDAYQITHTARQKKEERYATIGKISGGIAHEVRNPLNVIKTSIYFLQNAGDNIPPEKTKKHLDRIGQSVDDANKIVTALSQFARLPEPALSPVSISEIVSEAVEKNATGPIQVIIESELDNDQILGESAQLLIAFGNLIRNALQAIDSNGKVKVTLCEVKGKKSVVVKDNGKGISSENLSRIADPLFSTKTKGLGLGLAITKAIFDSHKAELIVDSEEGMGSEFKVLFPMRENETA